MTNLFSGLMLFTNFSVENGSMDSSYVPAELLRRQKEQMKQEIQVDFLSYFGEKKNNQKLIFSGNPRENRSM